MGEGCHISAWALQGQRVCWVWIWDIFRCIRLLFAQYFRWVLPTPNKLFNTLGAVTLTGVLLCLCCSNNSAKSSVSTQKQFLNENRKHLNGTDVEMPWCRSYWHARHNTQSFLKNDLIPRRAHMNVLCWNSYTRNNTLLEMPLIKLCHTDILFTVLFYWFKSCKVPKVFGI